MTFKSAAFLVFALVVSLNGTAIAGPRSAADKVAAACKGGDAGCLERALVASDEGLADARDKARAAIEGGALTGDDLKKTLAQFDASETAWTASRAAQCDAYQLYAKAIGDDAAEARWRCLVNAAFNRQSVLKDLFSSE